jgi:hypothetical protein
VQNPGEPFKYSYFSKRKYLVVVLQTQLGRTLSKIILGAHSNECLCKSASNIYSLAHSKTPLLSHKCTNTHTPQQIHAHTLKDTQVYANSHSCTMVYSDTHTFTCSHSHSVVHTIHAGPQAHTCPLVHTHAHFHVNIHTHVWLYLHMHTIPLFIFIKNIIISVNKKKIIL